VRVAAKDVGAAFKALVEAARKGGARILVSQLNEGDRRNVNARLDVDLRREHEADVEAAVKAAGELLQRTSHRAEDAENVVDSKIRINVTVLDLANLAPRETTKLSLAAKDVAASYKALVEAARKADAWVQQSYLAETDPQKVTAVLNLDVRREQEAVVAAALGAAGTVHTRTAQRAPENSGAVDAKVRYEIQIFDQARIDPRETHTLAVEVGDVPGAVGRLEQIAAEAKGQVEDAQHRRDSRTGRQESVLTLRVPLAEAAGALERIEKLGSLEAKDGQKHPNVPLNETATARLVVTLSNDLILSPEAGPIANIKRGLGVSLTALSYALMLIMVGVCFVLPIALIALGAVKLYKKVKTKPA
jgi:hypothetical protein